MTNQRHNDPDILESAIREFRRQGESQGPSSQALARTREAMREAGQKEPGTGLAERIRHMNRARIPLLVSGVAAAVIIAVAAWVFLSPAGTSGIAFADVRRQIEQAQTMTLLATVEMKSLKKPMMVKMFFKHPGLMRQEMTMDEGSLMGSATKPTATAPKAFKAINIFDMVKMNGVSLVPHMNKAMRFEFKNMPAEAVANLKKQDALEGFKKAVAGEHEELGTKTIDGQKAKGYRCGVPKAQSGGWELSMDIWVDASTGTPLVVEETLPEGMGKVTMTDFVVNPKLDDALFDTSVPKGYTVENQVVDFNVTEADVIKHLGLLAKACGGVFPKSLMPTPELIRQLGVEAKKAKLSEAQRKELGMGIQKMMIFQMQMAQSGEFVYAGEGVKLGDKATPILWYKAKDAKAYRVIYGDLHAEDARTPPVRPRPKPVDSKAGERDVTKYLRMFAERMGGDFPKDLIPTTEFFAHDNHPKTREASVKEKNEFVRVFHSTGAFQTEMRQNGEFVYAGEGVKLGDKATPILWYKAKDAKAYRVIYGDLHVEDAAAAPKRPATRPSGAATEPAASRP